MSLTEYKLGRLRRGHDPRIPHLSALVAGRTLPPPPRSVDWSAGMPQQLGMMRNDKLGDCTCAAFYHALQLWTFDASRDKRIDTEPDADVVELYILACGYNPAIPGEGPGGVEQDVLTYLLNQGAPTGPAGRHRHKIAAFVEVDPRNIDDVKRTINDCGVAYIGFTVPRNIVPPGAAPPKIWQVEGNPQIVGGHAVVLPGYDSDGVKVISWGQFYTMTWEFFAKYVDEVYAIADPSWIEKTNGKTPGGLSLDDLEAQMQALRPS
jgi:hypothetical protein